MSLRILREHLECCGDDAPGTFASKLESTKKRKLGSSKTTGNVSKGNRALETRKRKRHKKSAEISSLSTNQIVGMQAEKVRQRIVETKEKSVRKNLTKSNVRKLKRLDPSHGKDSSDRRTRMKGLTKSLLKRIAKGK